MYKILTFGEILKDVRFSGLDVAKIRDIELADIAKLIGEGSIMSADTAGLPVNLASYASFLGQKAFIIAKVGKDKWGGEIIEELEKFGVKIIWTQEKYGDSTDLALILLNDKRQPEFVKFIWNSLPSIEESDIKKVFVKNADIVHIGAAVCAFENSKKSGYKLADLARKSGKLVSFDLNLRKSIYPNSRQRYIESMGMIGRADIIKMSAAELLFCAHMGGESVATRSGMTLEKLFRLGEKLNSGFGKKMLLVTMGGCGAFGFMGNSFDWAPSYDFGELKNPIGAGDCFLAAALKKYFENKSLKEILNYGSRIAGISVTDSVTISPKVKNDQDLSGTANFETLEEMARAYAKQSKNDLRDFEILL